MTIALDRRVFVLGGLWGLGGLSTRSLGRPFGRPEDGPARTLVLIQLTGGNDGLSTLVPYSDDVYARSRRTTRIDEKEVLRLDHRVGLHPKLGHLHARFDQGSLALFEGVGYPQPNRSHFRSMDIWHAGDLRGRRLVTGWIGRCMEQLGALPAHSVVHFGAQPPFSLQCAHAPLCLTPGLLKAVEPDGPGLPEDAPQSPPGKETLSYLRAALAETRSSMDVLRGALGRRKTKVAYPSFELAQDLRRAAALIHAEIGVRVCSLELDGFDTHGNQNGRHNQLMEQLDLSLDAFGQDLQRSEAGREVLVLLFSEFGRRVEENASSGTDHGAAGLAMALGARVRGGLHGKAPRMDALEDGDIAFTTDFRSLYASAIRHVFGLDPAAILGAAFPVIEFV